MPLADEEIVFIVTLVIVLIVFIWFFMSRTCERTSQFSSTSSTGMIEKLQDLSQRYLAFLRKGTTRDIETQKKLNAAQARVLELSKSVSQLEQQVNNK